MKVIIPSTDCRQKQWFFWPPVMSFGFFDVLFWGIGLGISLRTTKLDLIISHTYGQHVWRAKGGIIITLPLMFLIIWNHPKHMTHHVAWFYDMFGRQKNWIENLWFSHPCQFDKYLLNFIEVWKFTHILQFFPVRHFLEKRLTFDLFLVFSFTFKF